MKTPEPWQRYMSLGVPSAEAPRGHGCIPLELIDVVGFWVPPPESTPAAVRSFETTRYARGAASLLRAEDPWLRWPEELAGKVGSLAHPRSPAVAPNQENLGEALDRLMGAEAAPIPSHVQPSGDQQSVMSGSRVVEPPSLNEDLMAAEREVLRLKMKRKLDSCSQELKQAFDLWPDPPFLFHGPQIAFPKAGDDWGEITGVEIGIPCLDDGDGLDEETDQNGLDPHQPGATATADQLLDSAATALRDRAASRDVAGERSMARCVQAFNALVDKGLTEFEGWLFMGVLKYARATAGNPQLDDLVDAAGYSALAGEVVAKALQEASQA